jgi:glycine dehydrogenase
MQKEQNLDDFQRRHIGPREDDLPEMLKTIGVNSMDDLIDETVPKTIRMNVPPRLPQAQTEYEYLEKLKLVAQKNSIFKSYIGSGYYNCITPSVIKRMIFENPGWYTQYTPYQAEISQGRLEALLNFQTMIIDLTGMDVANASLLDEGTAAAEAMAMLYRQRNRDKKKLNANRFFIDNSVYPQTVDVLKTRAEPMGIEIIRGHFKDYSFNETDFGALVQNPDMDGAICDYTSFIESAHNNGAMVTIAADIMSMVLLESPGVMGADVVIGSSQRFGVPMGYGGPHAAYFATRDEHKRQVPGRIIGVSLDRYGNPAYRMALQTREQHIRREKATSNICTAQALLAIMAGMYAIYHGPDGLRRIARRIHNLSCILDAKLKKIGLKQNNDSFFDTLKVKVSQDQLAKIQSAALKDKINLRYSDDSHIGIAVDETTSADDLKNIIRIFEQVLNVSVGIKDSDLLHPVQKIPVHLLRKDKILQHPVFNMHHSETKMMRYIKKLENKDLSLTSSMIPLGSCTMKLNPATAMLPVTWPEFSAIHPFVPLDQVRGYHEIISELEKFLSQITGLPATSLQPNSGAQGEYTGLMVIRAYHKSRGEGHRNVTLIPSSAHGTNPASAIMAGTDAVIVNCSENGDVDLDDLREKAHFHKDNLAALMITYPSTHGVFEEGIQEMCRIIHDNGGQVYMDGANMNAQVGLTSPGIIGADVCHLNLHKTFSIPHGGGGPGVGPICVAEHLAPFLPGHSVIKTGGTEAITAVAATPWGSASILLISYAYLKMLGTNGTTNATKYAILNANYIKSRLETYYPVLYSGKNGHVAHELIFDLRVFNKSAGIDAEDVAKRLMDFGFHAPTMSWPVPGTIMVEPTESESKDELDRFCDAMITIYQEIKEVENGIADSADNVLKNAPHAVHEAVADEWNHSYSREKAVFPASYVRENKFWSAVGRIDNTYGDRNLVCACPPLEAYMEES